MTAIEVDDESVGKILDAMPSWHDSDENEVRGFVAACDRFWGLREEIRVLSGEGRVKEAVALIPEFRSLNESLGVSQSGGPWESESKARARQRVRDFESTFGKLQAWCHSQEVDIATTERLRAPLFWFVFILRYTFTDRLIATYCANDVGRDGHSLTSDGVSFSDEELQALAFTNGLREPGIISVTKLFDLMKLSPWQFAETAQSLSSKNGMRRPASLRTIMLQHSKEDLQKLAAKYGLDVRSSWRKGEIVDLVLEHFGGERDLENRLVANDAIRAANAKSLLATSVDPDPETQEVYQFRGNLHSINSRLEVGFREDRRRGRYLALIGDLRGFDFFNDERPPFW